ALDAVYTRVPCSVLTRRIPLANCFSTQRSHSQRLAPRNFHVASLPQFHIWQSSALGAGLRPRRPARPQVSPPPIPAWDPRHGTLPLPFRRHPFLCHVQRSRL